MLDARAAPAALRERQEETARALCRRWSCGTGRGTQDRLLADVARSFATFAEVEPDPVPTCPFEGVFRGEGWPQELARARVLVSDEHLTWPDALGRPLTAVDVDALALFKRAENKLDRLQREQDELARQNREGNR